MLHRIEELSTVDTYRHICILEFWIEQTKKLLNKEYKSYTSSVLITESKSKKNTSYYFLEILNHPEKKNEAYAQLIQMTIDCTNLPADVVISAFSNAKIEANSLYDIPPMSFNVIESRNTTESQRGRRRPSSGSSRRGSSPVKVIHSHTPHTPQPDTLPIKIPYKERKTLFPPQQLAPSTIEIPHSGSSSSPPLSPKNKTIKIEMGKLEFTIQADVYHKLKRLGSEDDMMRLLLRYRPLGVDTGFFWSIPRDLYKYLSLDCGCEAVVECFASPFNHYLDEYCSAFEEDKKFGSKGGFYSYLQNLIDNGSKKKLIVNPPYVYHVINTVTDKCIEYIEKVPGAECIVLYPQWKSAPGVLKLMEYEYSKYRIFNGGEYTLHDYSIDDVIVTPMPLVLYVMCKGESTISIESITDKMIELHEEATGNKSQRSLSTSVGSPTNFPSECVWSSGWLAIGHDDI